MPPVENSPPRFFLSCLTAILLSLSVAAVRADDAKPTAPAPHFLTDTTVAWQDDRRVIAFELNRPADQDLTLETTSDDPEKLTVLRPAQVLQGQRLGFLRIETHAAGTVQLRVADASLSIEIKPSTAGWLQQQRRPKIISPASGAAVWGTIALAVEVFDDLDRLGDTQGAVQLILPDGRALPAVSVTPKSDGPHRRFVFHLDTDALPSGPITLTAQLDHKTNDPATSAPFFLHIVRPDQIQLTTREAEAHTHDPRPRIHGRQPKLKSRAGGTDPDGAFVVNNSAQPTLAFQLPLEQGGWFQVIATASGDAAAGTLPTVGLRIDAQQRATTASQIADTHWHRTPVGVPVWIDLPQKDERPQEVPDDGDGKAPPFTWPDHARILALRFENDFSAGREQDRNLFLDRYEIARLPGRPAPPAAPRDVASLPPDQVRGFFVTLDPQLHHHHAGGDLQIQGVIGGFEPSEKSAPQATLLVNGQPVQTQYAASPNFALSLGHLDQPTNTLQLLAQDPDTGQSALSATHTVTRDPEQKIKPRRAFTFLAADPHWQDADDFRQTHKRSKHQPLLAFFSEDHADLQLPEDLAGNFQIELQGFGDKFKGPPKARVSLRTADNATLLAEVEFQKNTHTQTLADIQLHPGPKTLRVAFINDHYDPKTKKDRNLYIQSLSLHEQPTHTPGTDSPDTHPPTAQLLYPQADQTLNPYDALVAQVSDNRNATWIEAVIDGTPTGLQHPIKPGASLAFAPIVLRQQTPGPAHPVHLAARIGDADGNITTTDSLTCVFTDPPDPQNPFSQSVRLLNRLGFGPEPALLADLLVHGQADFLDRHLQPGFDDPGLRDAWTRAAQRRGNEESQNNLRQRAASHQLSTPDPLRGRLTLFLDNHFSTWWSKARPEFRLADHARWVQLGPAPFPELLMASATSPAMLRYLDQQRSFAKKYNENYAREIMELHTLGVDAGYTQQDVTALAKLLTGWSYTRTARPDARGRTLDGAFRYIPQRNLPQAQTVLGMRFPPADPDQRYDRARSALEMLAAHPATASFISQKLVAHYLGPNPPTDVTDAATKTFLQTHGDLRQVILTIAKHPAFFDDQAQRLAHPIGFALRLQRLAHHHNPGSTVSYTNRAGVGLFDRDTPDGYPEEDAAYADSNATLQRWRFAGNIASAYINRLPKKLAYPGKLPDAAAELAWQQQLIDHFAGMMTGKLLSPTSNQAVLDVLQNTELRNWQRLKLTAQLIAQMPESALR